MYEIAAFMQNTADKLGFRRESFVEKNLPTTPSNLVIVPFFGDLESTFILSAFLARQLKQVGKYIVIVSWPGFRGLFPYADEFWSVKDELAVRAMADRVQEFSNLSDVYTSLTRNLIQHFGNVLTYEQWLTQYDHGFKSQEIKLFLPNVPASNYAAGVSGNIVVYPVKRMRSWQRGLVQYIDIPVEFWNHLIHRLKENHNPVVYQNMFTYDVSKTFADQCSYISGQDMSKTLAAIKSVGFLLDMHCGVSRLAIAARTPFLAVDEHVRYLEHKVYEVDDLACKTPRQYIFSFAAALLNTTPKDWDLNIVNQLLQRLKVFLPQLDKDALIETNEIYEDVPFSCVRERKLKKMGVSFIKRNKR